MYFFTWNIQDFSLETYGISNCCWVLTPIKHENGQKLGQLGYGNYTKLNFNKQKWKNAKNLSNLLSREFIYMGTSESDSPFCELFCKFRKVIPWLEIIFQSPASPMCAEVPLTGLLHYSLFTILPTMCTTVPLGGILHSFSLPYITAENNTILK